MNDAEADAIRKRITQWENADTVMRRLRDEDIRETDTASAMKLFEGSAAWAAQHRPAEPWSGLVEQQRWFSKLRKS